MRGEERRGGRCVIFELDCGYTDGGSAPIQLGITLVWSVNQSGDIYASRCCFSPFSPPLFHCLATLHFKNIVTLDEHWATHSPHPSFLPLPSLSPPLSNLLCSHIYYLHDFFFFSRSGPPGLILRRLLFFFFLFFFFAGG